MALPSELWQEVFSHLSTVDQTKLRAVCATWNRIMDAPALQSTIAIRNDPQNFLELYSVYKCLRPITRRLAVSSDRARWWFTDTARHLSDLIQYLAARQTGIRLRTIYLHRVLIYSMTICTCLGLHANECDQHPSPSRSQQDAECDRSWLQDFIEVCHRFPCDTILITNGIVQLSGSFYVKSMEEEIKAETKIRLRSAHFELGRDFACALWDALEAALPWRRGENLPELIKEWNMGGDSNYERVLRKLFCKTLCGAQSADPRPSAHYRGKKWCVDGLGQLRLEKLSRLTRHFLVEVLKNAARIER